jgi:hypothetical protein
VLPTIEADRPGARDPQHTVEDTAMVDRWSSSLRFFLHTHPRGRGRRAPPRRCPGYR